MPYHAVILILPCLQDAIAHIDEKKKGPPQDGVELVIRDFRDALDKAFSFGHADDLEGSCLLINRGFDILQVIWLLERDLYLIIAFLVDGVKGAPRHGLQMANIKGGMLRLRDGLRGDDKVRPSLFYIDLVAFLQAVPLGPFAGQRDRERARSYPVDLAFHVPFIASPYLSRKGDKQGNTVLYLSLSDYNYYNNYNYTIYL